MGRPEAGRSEQEKRLLEKISLEAAKGDMAIDSAAYAAAGREQREPVLFGSGSRDSRIGFFGRDPGRLEVEVGEPFVGKGGQLVRAALHRAATAGRQGAGSAEMSFQESLEAGREVFWANMVPFKPLGNKAWSTAVQRRFLPFIREALTEVWSGSELITLGNRAFFWFGLAERALKPTLEEYWRRSDRYEATNDRKTYRRG